MSTQPVGSVPTWAQQAPSQVNRTDQMDQETFLKLLVAQLRYQDPSKPVDSSQFMAQTAAFTQVQKLTELADLNSSMMMAQRLLSAGVLVGSQARYLDEDGQTATGTISAVRLNTDEPVAVIGGKDVPMGRIQEVVGAGTTP